jgi:hypothetical protein
MSKGKKIWILLAVAILIAIVSVACGPKTTPEPIPPTSTPPTGISREEAIEIVIKKIAEPSEAPYGLRVYMYPEFLSKGSTVEPYAMWLGGEKWRGEQEFVICKADCWFFWFDENPLAEFAHETRFVLVDASTGEVMVQESQWWPVVNGKVMWGTAAERASDKLLIYEKPFEKFEGQLDAVSKHEPEPVDVEALPGCEGWAIIVCGEGDTGMSFDENVHGVYDVFTGLGYPDDHIFYVSPWTSDPGVDRVTSVANIEWAIDEVADRSDEEDKVFFYYTSHGGVDYFVVDPDPSDPHDGGLVYSDDLDDWLDDITSRDMIILLQACHCGSFIGAYWDGTVVAAENELTGDGETNRIVVTATDTDHSSYPDLDPATPPTDPNPGDTGSEFSGGYIEAFSAAAADVDSNGAISVDEAYTYAFDNDIARIRSYEYPQIDLTSLVPASVFHACTPVDLWISDGPHDIGNNSYDYDSTDIWSSLSPTGTSHDDPVSGLTNYVHVRVHNLGSSSVSNVDVALYWADTSTALAWPSDFHQIGSTFPIPAILAGGNVEHTWSWDVDPAIGLGHHFCFVATADSTADPMTGGPPGATYVAPYDNNIAQKNITIVEVPAGESAHVWFFIENNMDEMMPFDLVIRRADFPEGQLLLSLPDDLTRGLLERTDFLDGLEFVDRKGQEMPGLLVTAKEEAAIRQIELKPLDRREVTLEVIASEGAEVGEEFTVRIEEVAKEEVIGANTFLVRIVPPGDCPSTLKQAAEVYAQIALKYKSEAAAKLVEIIGESLLAEICQDREAVMEWKYAAFDLEARVGDELQGQVPEEALEAYFEAVKALEAALEAGDFEEMMIAQEAVVEAGATFVTARP